VTAAAKQQMRRMSSDTSPEHAQAEYHRWAKITYGTFRVRLNDMKWRVRLAFSSVRPLFAPACLSSLETDTIILVLTASLIFCRNYLSCL
jgi:hypothetical protein